MKNELTTNQNQTTAAEATDYPELFRDTYWGRFTLARNPDITSAIIRNRNRIAAEWELVRQIEAYTLLAAGADVRADFDHAEAYESRWGWIFLLCANDSKPPPPVLGMKPIPPVYTRGVRSYAARYATRREFRARLEAVASGSGRKKFSAVRNLFTEPPTPRRSARQARGRLMA
jgi:hypothetical protein